MKDGKQIKVIIQCHKYLKPDMVPVEVSMHFSPHLKTIRFKQAPCQICFIFTLELCFLLIKIQIYSMLAIK